jgi:hypothetical protein
MMGVRVKAAGPTGYGTTLTNAETGDEINGVSRLAIYIVPDDIIRVDAEIFSAELDVAGRATFRVTDPGTGEVKEVSRIEFADGTAWEAA